MLVIRNNINKNIFHKNRKLKRLIPEREIKTIKDWDKYIEDTMETEDVSYKK